MSDSSEPESVNDGPLSEEKYLRSDASPAKPSVKRKDARIYAAVAGAFFVLAIVALIIAQRVDFDPRQRNPAQALAIFSFTAALVLGIWSATRFVEDVNYDSYNPEDPNELTPGAKVVQLFVGALWAWSLWFIFVNPLIPIAFWALGALAIGRRRWSRSIFLGGVLGCLTTPVLLLGLCFFASGRRGFF